MSISDLRIFIVLIEIVVLVTAYTPIVIHISLNRHRDLTNMYYIMWFLTGLFWGLAISIILSGFVA